MSGPLHTGSVSRAVRGFSIEAARALSARQEMLAQDGLREITQQYQLKVKGAAGLSPFFVRRTVEFDTIFVIAHGQRDPSFDVPHFSFGSVCEKDVIIAAHVRKWTLRDGDDAVTGCEVIISASSAVADQPFEGYVHLTFQGFGAPIEEDGNLDDSS